MTVQSIIKNSTYKFKLETAKCLTALLYGMTKGSLTSFTWEMKQLDHHKNPTSSWMISSWKLHHIVHYSINLHIYNFQDHLQLSKGLGGTAGLRDEGFPTKHSFTNYGVVTSYTANTIDLANIAVVCSSCHGFWVQNSIIWGGKKYCHTMKCSLLEVPLSVKIISLGVNYL